MQRKNYTSQLDKSRWNLHLTNVDLNAYLAPYCVFLPPILLQEEVIYLIQSLQNLYILKINIKHERQISQLLPDIR